MTLTLTPDQWLILFTGVPAVFLSQSSNESARRYACLFGLAGQGAWYVASWKAGQLGIFLISFLYTFGWLKGVWTHWIIPWKAKYA